MRSVLLNLEVILPLALVVVILVTVVWVLYHQNKKIFEKLRSEKSRFFLYKSGIQKLQESPSNALRDFEKLNKIARNFFKEYFNLSYNLTYLELEEQFQKKNKPDYAKFSRLMSNANYSGEKITSKDIKQLTNLFSQIIEDY